MYIGQITVLWKLVLSTCLAHRCMESPAGSYTQVIPSVDVGSRHVHRHGLPPSLPPQLLQVLFTVQLRSNFIDLIFCPLQILFIYLWVLAVFAEHYGSRCCKWLIHCHLSSARDVYMHWLMFGCHNVRLILKFNSHWLIVQSWGWHPCSHRMLHM